MSSPYQWFFSPFSSWVGGCPRKDVTEPKKDALTKVLRDTNPAGVPIVPYPPYTGTYPMDTKRLYAQRNLYLCAWALFMPVVLGTIMSLAQKLSKKEKLVKELEVSGSLNTTS